MLHVRSQHVNPPCMSVTNAQGNAACVDTTKILLSIEDLCNPKKRFNSKNGNVTTMLMRNQVELVMLLLVATLPPNIGHCLTYFLLRGYDTLSRVDNFAIKRYSCHLKNHCIDLFNSYHLKHYLSVFRCSSMKRFAILSAYILHWAYWSVLSRTIPTQARPQLLQMLMN